MHTLTNKILNTSEKIKGKGTAEKYKHLKLGNHIFTDKKEISNIIVVKKLAVFFLIFYFVLVVVEFLVDKLHTLYRSVVLNIVNQSSGFNQTRGCKMGGNLTIKWDLYFRYRTEDLKTPYYWPCSSELCINFEVCIVRLNFDQSDSVFKTQCTIFEDDKSYVFMSLRACSPNRSKGNKVKASEIPSDA